MLGLPAKVQDACYARLEALADGRLPRTAELVKHLRGELWELRVITSGHSVRLVYARVPQSDYLVVLGFKKTTQRTPTRLLDTADGRLQEWLARHEGGKR